MTQELILTGEVAVYNPFRQTLAEMKKQNEETAFDYESSKGNKDARSYVYKLRQSKAAVDKARKEEKAVSLEYGRKVDAEAKQIIDAIESMIEVHQRPLDEIEEREKSRIEAIKSRIASFYELPSLMQNETAQCLLNAIGDVKSIKLDNAFGEFLAEAGQKKDETIAKLEELLAARQKYEAEQAELEKLRKEAAEREQKEREERIAHEAAEKARLDAEAKAEAQKRAIEEKARQEREAAERRELEQKLALERAERDREQAMRDAELAAQREREKIEAEQKKAEQEKADREKQVEHVKRINNSIVLALSSECGIDGEAAKLIVIAIRKGLIPNTVISY